MFPNKVRMIGTTSYTSGSLHKMIPVPKAQNAVSGIAITFHCITKWCASRTLAKLTKELQLND
jgi:hypothetical protein